MSGENYRGDTGPQGTPGPAGKDAAKRPWHDSFVVGALVMGIAVGGVIIFKESDRFFKENFQATNHIKAVTATDKNCNDCHLGASFVNLFNNPAVKSNDNVITLMMDKAKIKRW
jgi:hypothetical protein